MRSNRSERDRRLAGIKANLPSRHIGARRPLRSSVGELSTASSQSIRIDSSVSCGGRRLASKGHSLRGFTEVVGTHQQHWLGRLPATSCRGARRAPADKPCRLSNSPTPDCILTKRMSVALDGRGRADICVPDVCRRQQFPRVYLQLFPSNL